ncbi:MAG: alpha/beta fold hydrolase [Cyclobacteriaceae bacterium]|nr:alpha/beta fold hydrolase [Cyclobacteriaceae bacterium]
MPLVKSTYNRHWLLFNSHLETIVPSVFRSVDHIMYRRERISTIDNDFLDLDWVQNDHSRLVVVSHGLEGSSDRDYVKGMVRIFSENEWDVLAWNCRSCSGEINQSYKLYHHGATEDLHDVLSYVIKRYPDYSEIVLVGFSMGGSLSLKYIGERGAKICPMIKGVIAFSTPCNLESSARRLSEKGNGFYRKRFLKKLKGKILLKAAQFPDMFDLTDIDAIEHFVDFDSRFTAPIYGFASASDFYRHASAENYLHNVKIPVLIVNALNDPMLPEACFPVDIARKNPMVFLEMPLQGGHVGFYHPGKKYTWAEVRALDFTRTFLGMY